MPEIYVAIGSNVNPEEHVRSALVALAGNFGVLRLSPVYRNRPVGFEGDEFLNMVAAFDTDAAVEEVEAAGDPEQRYRRGARSGSHGQVWPQTLVTWFTHSSSHEVSRQKASTAPGTVTGGAPPSGILS